MKNDLNGKTIEAALESVNALIAKFEDGGAYAGDTQQLKEWRRQLKEAGMTRSYREHPVTKLFIEKSASAIAEADRLLSTVEDMTDAQRRSMFAHKRFHRDYLESLDLNDEKITALVAAIDAEARDDPN